MLLALVLLVLAPVLIAPVLLALALLAPLAKADKLGEASLDRVFGGRSR